MLKQFLWIPLVLALIGCVEEETTDVSFHWNGGEPLRAAPCIKPAPGGVEACRADLDVRLGNPRCQVLSIDGSMTVTYEENGRDDRTSVSNRVNGNGGPNLRLILQTDEVRGGNAAISGSVSYRCPRGPTRTESKSTTEVFSGANPSLEQVCGRIMDTNVRALAFLRTGFRMFDDTHKPVYNGDGHGLSAEPALSAEAVWHWEKNADHLIDRYAAVQAEARAFPEALRAQGYDVEDFSERELMAETFARMEGGHWFAPNERGPGWTEAEDRPASVPELLSIITSVTYGQPPAGWCTDPQGI